MFSKRIHLIILLAAGILILAACNLPQSEEASPTGPSLDYTQAAQTVAAIQTQNAAGTPVAVISPTGLVVTYTPTAVLSPTGTAIPGNTATPTVTPIPPTATQVSVPCDRAEFIDDVTIEDGTEIPAGTTFVKTWRLRNNGSCTWTSGYAVVFYSGDAMSGPASAQLTTGTVPPQGTVDVSVTLIAPTTAGTYRGNWRLRNSAGATFGIGPNADQSFYVEIRSVIPRTPTPTLTPTPAMTLSFDFIARGPDAQWRNATATIPWGDPPNDSAGVAVNIENVRMEDNRTYARLLATYPQHITDGMIAGLYPNYTVQANDRFRATIGIRDDCDEGRVRFIVRVVEGDHTTELGSWLEACNGTLTSVDIPLTAWVGHTVRFELVVLAEGSPDNDVSLWIQPRIER